MNRILVVEDEQPIRMALVDTLEAEGYEVLEAANGKAAIDVALTQDPDAVLLDLNIPKPNGFEVLRTLREDRLTATVLILSARGAEMDRIQGFEYGADDYIVKPYSTDELLARLRAALARRGGSTPGVNEIDRVRTVSFGDVTVDFGSYSLVRAGERHGLSRREMDLLRHFLEHDGDTLPRQELVASVWGPMPSTGKPPTARTVDQHVMMLRKKIEARADQPQHLKTVHGVGYRFRAHPPSAGEDA
ncbi:MAG: response regulator transcription factor [Planctomycetota bacterium]